MHNLRVNGIVDESIVDGPGLRFVVFTQGCPHLCPGCHNPETHDPAGGYLVETAALFSRFSANPLLTGVTFSGGEPFLQAASLVPFARQVKSLGKTVMAYTGYTFEQLLARSMNTLNPIRSHNAGNRTCKNAGRNGFKDNSGSLLNPGIPHDPQNAWKKFSHDSIGELLGYVDILVDGPYVEELRDLELSFRGSSNQRMLDAQAMQKLRIAYLEKL